MRHQLAGKGHGGLVFAVLDRPQQSKPLMDLLGKEGAGKDAGTDPDGLYTRAPQQDAMAAGENPQFPTSSHDADAVIAGVKAAFLAQHGAAIPFRIEKVRVMADLPAALQASAGRQNVGESGRGVFYNNTIYVVQNAHSPPSSWKRRFSTNYTAALRCVAPRSRWTPVGNEKHNALMKALGSVEGMVKVGLAA